MERASFVFQTSLISQKIRFCFQAHHVAFGPKVIFGGAGRDLVVRNFLNEFLAVQLLEAVHVVGGVRGEHAKFSSREVVGELPDERLEQSLNDTHALELGETEIKI